MFFTKASIAARQPLINKPRQSGRTYSMILTIPEEDFYKQVYIVAHTYQTAKMIVDRVREIRGSKIAGRCVPVSSQGAIKYLRGVDPLSVFIDHTALEYGAVRDIKYLYSIIDRQTIYEG